MADFKASGIAELAAEMKNLGQLDNGELVEKMLDAGAQVVKTEWENGIRKTVKNKDRRSTGALEKSVKVDKKVTILQGVSSKNIAPSGKDSKGVRNAEKAYILHYGKSGQPATLFVDEIESKAEEKAVEEMQNVFNEFMKTEEL